MILKAQQNIGCKVHSRSYFHQNIQTQWNSYKVRCRAMTSPLLQHKNLRRGQASEEQNEKVYKCELHQYKDYMPRGRKGCPNCRHYNYEDTEQSRGLQQRRGKGFVKNSESSHRLKFNKDSIDEDNFENSIDCDATMVHSEGELCYVNHRGQKKRGFVSNYQQVRDSISRKRNRYSKAHMNRKKSSYPYSSQTISSGRKYCTTCDDHSISKSQMLMKLLSKITDIESAAVKLNRFTKSGLSLIREMFESSSQVNCPVCIRKLSSGSVKTRGKHNFAERGPSKNESLQKNYRSSSDAMKDTEGKYVFSSRTKNYSLRKKYRNNDLESFHSKTFPPLIRRSKMNYEDHRHKSCLSSDSEMEELCSSDTKLDYRLSGDTLVEDHKNKFGRKLRRMTENCRSVRGSDYSTATFRNSIACQTSFVDEEGVFPEDQKIHNISSKECTVETLIDLFSVNEEDGGPIPSENEELKQIDLCLLDSSCEVFNLSNFISPHSRDELSMSSENIELSSERCLGQNVKTEDYNKDRQTNNSIPDSLDMKSVKMYSSPKQESLPKLSKNTIFHSSQSDITIPQHIQLPDGTEIPKTSSEDDIALVTLSSCSPNKFSECELDSSLGLACLMNSKVESSSESTKSSEKRSENLDSDCPRIISSTDITDSTENNPNTRIFCAIKHEKNGKYVNNGMEYKDRQTDESCFSLKSYEFENINNETAQNKFHDELKSTASQLLPTNPQASISRKKNEVTLFDYCSTMKLMNIFCIRDLWR